LKQQIILAFAIAAIPESTAASDNWTLVNDGRGVKAYPNLREYVWQKNATMAPNGLYDKIGLHRLVKIGSTPKGVLFICPGTWSSGEQLISNPPNDTWTKYENYSQPIYWANRGYDVYAIDYRTHFVPITMNASQLSFMANWGWDQWISDIREGVLKTKELSGASKVFMAGESFGGHATMSYASKYWREDLRGIILLDGGNATKNPNPANSYNLTAMLSAASNTSAWSTEYPNINPFAANPPVGVVFANKYALENPGAPAQFPPGTPLTPTINPLTNRTWTNITEWFAFGIYYSFTYPGGASNTLGGYGNTTLMVQWGASSDRYWSTRLSLESIAMNNWVNCPYVTYDFDDHYSEIDVPLLGYTSGKYGLFTWGPIGNIANSDVTRTVLPNYGHGDVYAGVYSQPVVDWMGSQLVGQKATAFCNVTVLTGWTWWFFAHSTGGIGPHAYQWYEGTTLLQGQTSMVLPVTKTTPGTYTFYCKVTGSEGTTTNSNPVTLTVLG
jgi:pimeloyl-ACP methyl ester carboxylesterase